MGDDMLGEGKPTPEQRCEQLEEALNSVEGNLYHLLKENKKLLTTLEGIKNVANAALKDGNVEYRLKLIYEDAVAAIKEYTE